MTDPDASDASPLSIADRREWVTRAVMMRLMHTRILGPVLRRRQGAVMGAKNFDVAAA